jgi:hypothetical protein
MSPGVSLFLLHALIDDFSSVPRSGGPGGIGRAARPAPYGPAPSPAVGRRAVGAEACIDGAADAVLDDPATPVLIHGTPARALTAWRGAAARRPDAGLDVTPERDRHSVESVHRSLALLTDLPRNIPVTVGLALGPGWHNALDLVQARGRTVRFSVCGVDAPDAKPLVEAVRTAAAVGCGFSWSSGPWRAVTDPLDAPLPGILNVLLATAAALRGAGPAEIAMHLACTDTVDVVDAATDLDDAEARRVRSLLGGFAVREAGLVVDSFIGLGLLPKEAAERTAALV